MEELKRLTTEYKGKSEMICGFEDCMTDEDICPACNLRECACLQAVIEKLKSYEDAEERDYKTDIMDDLSKYNVDSLEELVANVRNKAIDDFVGSLKDYFVIPHDVRVIEMKANELKAGVSKCIRL